MFLKPFKEARDFLEDDAKRIVARDDALRRLYEFLIRPLRAREIYDDNYRDEDTGTSENDIRG